MTDTAPLDVSKLWSFIVSQRLAGASAAQAALAAVALGLDGGLVTAEDVLETADDSPGAAAQQSARRDWAASAVLLRSGDFAGAYRALLAELTPSPAPTTRAKVLRTRRGPLPLWSGEPVDALTVVLHEGLGDALLVGRYLAGLRARAGRVIVLASRKVVDLLARAGVEAMPFRRAGEALADADCWVHMMAMPHLSGEGYGAADWLRVNRPARRPGPLRCGLCWGGNPANSHNALRSIPIARWAPILDLPGIEWHSLQLGPQAAECPGNVIDHAHELKTFTDTAALVADLDLVLTVDTSVANLAGAMGHPVWTLIEFDGDFRWGPAGDRTAWYPSAKVFRQRTPNDWTPVVLEVAAALRELRVTP